jgi:hypothetical protein
LQTRQVVAPIITIAIIALALGTAVGYTIFFKTTTTTTTTTLTPPGIAYYSTITSTYVQHSNTTQYFVIYSGNGSVTVTKEILEESVGGVQVEISGNCTVSGGTGYLTNTSTTEYLLPSYVSNSSESLGLVTAAITTVTSSVSGIGITDLTRTVSFNISEYGNVTEIILSTRTNGTETYVATATCPIVA